MNKREWKKYFEEINSREPNEDEIKHALISEEFSENVSSKNKHHRQKK